MIPLKLKQQRSARELRERAAEVVQAQREERYGSPVGSAPEEVAPLWANAPIEPGDSFKFAHEVLEISPWNFTLSYPEYLTFHGVKPPNRFHRFMQKLLLGIHWWKNESK